MRLPSFLLSLLAASSVQAAEWIELPQPASSLVAIYHEPAMDRQRHGAFVGLFVRNPRQGWFLLDYAVPHRWQLHELRSARQWLEFDCGASSVRLLARQYYAGPMGQGRLLASEGEQPRFVPVAPGDPEQAMLQAVCTPARGAQSAAAR